MRLVLYNICYGIGVANRKNLALHGARYLLGNQKNVLEIADFIADLKADVIGLVEVDSGSLRARKIHQAKVIADQLGHYTAYECKYGKQSIKCSSKDYINNILITSLASIFHCG